MLATLALVLLATPSDDEIRAIIRDHERFALHLELSVTTEVTTALAGEEIAAKFRVTNTGTSAVDACTTELVPSYVLDCERGFADVETTASHLFCEKKHALAPGESFDVDVQVLVDDEAGELCAIRGRMLLVDPRKCGTGWGCGRAELESATKKSPTIRVTPTIWSLWRRWTR